MLAKYLDTFSMIYGIANNETSTITVRTQVLCNENNSLGYLIFGP